MIAIKTLFTCVYEAYDVHKLDLHSIGDFSLTKLTYTLLMPLS